MIATTDANNADWNNTIDASAAPKQVCIALNDIGEFFITSIAAASILAKTYRDDLMISLSKEYPQFGWDRNMAYPTAEHRAAILKYGITPYHRKTFVHIQEELFK